MPPTCYSSSVVLRTAASSAGSIEEEKEDKMKFNILFAAVICCQLNVKGISDLKLIFWEQKKIVGIVFKV